MRAIVVVLGINNDMFDKAWFPDSGATNHFTNDFNNLNIGTKYQGNKKRNMGNGAGLDILHIGQSTFSLPISSHPLILRNLLHVPHITKNLISVSEFHVPHMTKNLISLSQFARENQFLAQVVFNQVVTHKSQHQNNFALWHQRLGHSDAKVVKLVLSHCNEVFSSNDKSLFCVAYHLGKIRKLPFPISGTQYTRSLQLVHFDLWGPSPSISTITFRYYVTFIDAYSGFIWIYFLKNKLKVFHVFQHFKTQAELHHNWRLKTSSTDWGGECHSLRTLLQNSNIIHQLSCPHTLEQNGVAECKRRHIVESSPYTFLGYNTHHKGYKCISHDGKLYISFPFAQFSSSSLPESSQSSPLSTPFAAPPVLAPSLSCSPTLSLHTPSTTTLVLPPTASSIPHSSFPTPSTPSLKLVNELNTHPMIIHAKDGIYKPKVFAIFVCEVIEPPNVQIALSDKTWKNAMQEEKSYEVQSLISHLHMLFSLKDLGPLNFLLGIEVHKLHDGNFHLSQGKYVTDLLERAKMLNPKSMPTPMIIGALLSAQLGNLMQDPTLYRSIVGALHYVTIIRPEISYYNKVCQFMQHPFDIHWKTIKRILRFLKGTTHHGLLLHKPDNLFVTGYSDVD
uniref:Integrase catalytic domain-containing protein n=1 Tax=Vitis vinifera TaxID=29760 RepID=A5BL12_VITVI|nr:hypothetical protein VITISV_036882 [Vitis vinifera]